MERSRATGAGVDDSINLDVHGIAKLQDDGVPPTNDTAKQDYAYVDGRYAFKPIKSKVIALRYAKDFHPSAENGDVGVILENTNFYAEQVSFIIY